MGKIKIHGTQLKGRVGMVGGKKHPGCCVCAGEANRSEMSASAPLVLQLSYLTGQI